MENIPRSTQCVQQHLSPTAQFFTEEELATSREELAPFIFTTAEPEVMSEAEWAKVEAATVRFDAEYALTQRISGHCGRCTVECGDLIGYQNEGICGDCAVGLVEVAS